MFLTSAPVPGSPTPRELAWEFMGSSRLTHGQRPWVKRLLRTWSDPTNRNGVADGQVSDLGQMDADLVGPAGLEPAGHLAGHLAEALADLEVSHGGKTLGKDAGNPAAAVAVIGRIIGLERSIRPIPYCAAEQARPRVT